MSKPSTALKNGPLNHHWSAMVPSSTSGVCLKSGRSLSGRSKAPGSGHRFLLNAFTGTPRRFQNWFTILSCFWASAKIRYLSQNGTNLSSNALTKVKARGVQGSSKFDFVWKTAKPRLCNYLQYFNLGEHWISLKKTLVKNYNEYSETSSWILAPNLALGGRAMSLSHVFWAVGRPGAKTIHKSLTRVPGTAPSSIFRDCCWVGLMFVDFLWIVRMRLQMFDFLINVFHGF